MDFRFLTDEFYNDYKHCSEMEKKNNRPYASLCLIEFNNLYFAHAYASWEKGSNERNNRILREVYPKRTNFDDVSDDELAYVANTFNNRPKKILNYKTPLEVINSVA